MATPEVHTLTGPYVLNALPEDERIGFESHLADCESCTAEVAELREAAHKLGTAVAVQPPAALKARVIAATAVTRQLPPLVGRNGHDSRDSRDSRDSGDHRDDRTDRAARVEQGEQEDRTDRDGQGKPLARHRRTFDRRSFLSLAAAGAAVLGAGGIALDQYRDNDRTQRQNEQLAAVLAEPDAKTVRNTVDGGGQAVFVSSARRDEAVVLLKGLRRLPDEQTYQLWLIDPSQQAFSVGLVAGQAVPDVTRVIRGGVAGKAAFGLTVERKGGAQQPTMPAAVILPLA
jgi:anti-sigma-K factor RskA